MESNSKSDSIELNKVVNDLIEINNIKKITLNEIIQMNKIGEGLQAKVYQGEYENENVAIKIIEKYDYKCLAHEINIISNLHHQNIPKFKGIVLENNKLRIVTQYVEAKSLDEYKPSEISFEVRVDIIKQLASVLEYMHSQKTIHRDLKPENMLFNQETCKLFLIDFGISKVLSEKKEIETRAKGTPHYLAPESLVPSNIDENDAMISMIGPSVDIWAFGCVTSWLFSGILPWCNIYKNNPATLQAVLMKKKPFPVPVNIANENIVLLITKCTMVNIKERWNITEITKFLDSI